MKHCTLAIAGVLALLTACIGLPGCAEEGGPGAQAPSGDVSSCSAQECDAIPDPAISPSACGAGNAKDIGSACVRDGNGSCRKVVSCGQ